MPYRAGHGMGFAGLTILRSGTPGVAVPAEAGTHSATSRLPAGGSRLSPGSRGDAGSARRRLRLLRFGQNVGPQAFRPLDIKRGVARAIDLKRAVHGRKRISQIRKPRVAVARFASTRNTIAKFCCVPPTRSGTRWRVRSVSAAR